MKLLFKLFLLLLVLAAPLLAPVTPTFAQASPICPDYTNGQLNTDQVATLNVPAGYALRVGQASYGIEYQAGVENWEVLPTWPSYISRTSSVTVRNTATLVRAFYYCYVYVASATPTPKPKEPEPPTATPTITATPTTTRTPTATTEGTATVGPSPTTTPMAPAPFGCVSVASVAVNITNSGSWHGIDWNAVPWVEPRQSANTTWFWADRTVYYGNNPGMFVRYTSGAIPVTGQIPYNTNQWVYYDPSDIGDWIWLPAAAYGLVNGSAPFTADVCPGGTSTPTPVPTSTRTPIPTSTHSPTPTETPTQTPTFTITPTPTIGSLGCAGAEYMVPVAPNLAEIPLTNGQQFVVADATIYANLPNYAQPLHPGIQTWTGQSGNYVMYSLTVQARIVVCVSTPATPVVPSPTFLPTPRPPATGEPPACVALPPTATVIAFAMPDLSIVVPTLRPLGSPTPTGTVGVTIAISTTAVAAFAATVQAGLATPVAAAATASAPFSWSSGVALSATAQIAAAPALSWLAILNPRAPAWQAEGGPLWALAPAIWPVMPAVGVFLLAALARFFLWLLAWFLKLVDLIIKLIELIPGE